MTLAIAAENWPATPAAGELALAAGLRRQELTYLLEYEIPRMSASSRVGWSAPSSRTSSTAGEGLFRDIRVHLAMYAQFVVRTGLRANPDRTLSRSGSGGCLTSAIRVRAADCDPCDW